MVALWGGLGGLLGGLLLLLFWEEALGLASCKR